MAKHLFILVTLLAVVAVASAADLTKNGDGVAWLDTTDEWGRPWGDAASDFYHRLDDQRRLLKKQDVNRDRLQFAVGTEISLRKVFRPKVWFKGGFSGVVFLEAARGEAQSFQLVVCPLADAERDLNEISDERAQGEGSLKPKTVAIKGVEISPLEHEQTNDRIEPDRFEIYRVGYIRTVAPQYPVMHVGEWPDPLLPFEPFEVANPYCQPLWFDVRVPRDAAAGTYRGRITVKGPHDVVINLILTVWDFTLPDPPKMFAMGWQLNDWFTRDGIEPLLKRLDVLLDHRIAPWHLAYSYHKNLPDHDRVMQHLLDRGVQIQSTQGNPPAEFVDHLRKKDWLKHYICIWGDEPHPRDYPAYRKRSEQLRAQHPGLTVAMTDEPTPEQAGLFDMWITEPAAHNEPNARQARARGERTWWYHCQLPIHARYLGPIHATPGVVVDRPAIDHRITYWLAFKHRIDGVAYWAISHWPDGWQHWPKQPWPVNPRVPFPYSGQHNANGFLCYPGSDGLPWPSIRLKTIRDGLQDYDYLNLLPYRGVTVNPELAGGLRYYNKDPKVLLDTRHRLAQKIVELGHSRH